MLSVRVPFDETAGGAASARAARRTRGARVGVAPDLERVVMGGVSLVAALGLGASAPETTAGAAVATTSTGCAACTTRIGCSGTSTRTGAATGTFAGAVFDASCSRDATPS